MLQSSLVFLISAAVIVVAGTKLSYYGDRLAKQTGFGGLWIGVVLMAAATSLPEVFTTVSASLLDLPDLAAGDLFGAVMTNMLTLGLIDQIYRSQRVWERATFGHTLVACLAMGLTALAGFFILLELNVVFLAVGLDTAIVLLLYILGMRMIYRQEEAERERRAHGGERDNDVPDTDPAVDPKRELRRSSIGFSFATLAIIVAAPALASSAGRIAEETGISTTFIGTTLVAITTSLPELVTSFAAVRLGAVDLAVGNLFGSNAFNMAALFFADAAYQKGPLLAAVSSTHALSAVWGVLLMNLALMGIIYRAGKRNPLLEPNSRLMILGYLLGMWLLFR